MTTLRSLIQAAANAVGITIDAHVVIGFSIPPSAPTVLGITSVRGNSMAALLNTIVFSLAPAAGVTRVATITITPTGGVAEAPITLDVTNPATTFPSNDGDSVSVSAIDSNAAGASSASALFTTTTTAPGGGGGSVVPSAPVITGVTSVLA